MKPDPARGDIPLHHCLDASLQKFGGMLQLNTPAGPLSMTLPPGLKEGQSLRLAGRGELGPDGKRGDVLLTVSFFSTVAATPSPVDDGSVRRNSAVPSNHDVPSFPPGTDPTQAAPVLVAETMRPDEGSLPPLSASGVPGEPTTIAQPATAPAQVPERRTEPSVGAARVNRGQQKSTPRAPKPPGTSAPNGIERAKPAPAPTVGTVSKTANDGPETSGRGTIVMVIVAAAALMFLFYQKRTLVDPYSTKGPVKPVTVTPGGGAAEAVRAMQDSLVRRMPTALEAWDHAKREVEWAKEKRKMLEDDRAGVSGRASVPQVITDPENVENGERHQLVIVDEQSFLRRKRVYEKFGKGSVEQTGTAHSKVLEEILGAPKPTYVNITRRMGVDAASMSGLTREQAMERFLGVIHCVFFTRPYPKDIRERIVSTDQFNRSGSETLGNLAVRVRGSFQSLAALVDDPRSTRFDTGVATVPFDIWFKSDDVYGMANRKFMDEIRALDEKSRLFPQCFEAIKQFEKQWLEQQPVTEQRLSDLKWWRVREPLLVELHGRHRGSFNSSFPERPALTLDEEILSKLRELIVSQRNTRFDHRFSEKSLVIKAVTVTEGRHAEAQGR